MEVRKLSTPKAWKGRGETEEEPGVGQTGTGQTWGLVGHGREFGLHPKGRGSH